MKKDFLIIITLAVSAFGVYHTSFFNFFTQDDFILINHFSQNSLWQNLVNVFGSPTVTHWRPIHNLYFLISGSLFGKNYIGYHLLTLLFLIITSFFIYRVIYKLIKNHLASITAAIIYVVHPAHFVSLYWISGAATLLGFFFLITSFYYYLLKKNIQALVLYIFSLMASEAMLAGTGLFLAHQFLFLKSKPKNKFLLTISVISVIFVFLKLLMFTPQTTFASYHLTISRELPKTIKYYLLRIVGFAEISGDQIVSIILIFFIIFVIFNIVITIPKDKQLPKKLLFSLLIIFLGLFPFIFIPDHLSPHYMNISIFGFSIVLALGLSIVNRKMAILTLLIFILIAFYNINLTGKNSWVIKRSNLAQAYLQKIQMDNPPPGTLLIFNDNNLSSSEEAYYALGTGQAINFWFPEKNYRTCFTKFEKCPTIL